ncbi:LURP-one-related/scramblase family protein [Actinophytocola sediminis]
MDVRWLQAQQQFHVHQKITMMINRYEVFADDARGEPGAPVAFVEQKRMAFKEQVTLFTDESKQSVLAGFTARKVIDLASAYDVTTADGAPIGVFGKRFGKSLFRSTWQLDQPGQQPVVARERSLAMALFRRVWDFLPFSDVPFPWKYHFELTRDDTLVGTVVKKTRFRDHYLVRIEDPTLDRRLVLALAIALDALQSR